MDSPRSPPAPEQSEELPNASSEGEKRPAQEEPASPVKYGSPDSADRRRQRTASKGEDRARGKRLFGNLLGTLRKFQDDEKSSSKSEAAKRREETASRIADKLKTEQEAMHNLQTAERELRDLKTSTANAGHLVEDKQVAMTSRHAGLRATETYLFTSTPSRPSLHGALYSTSLAPLCLVSTGSKTVPPLYFRPKVLTPSQEESLAARAEEIARTISEEEESLEEERKQVDEAAEGHRAKIAELEERVRRLRSEVGDKAPRRRERENANEH